MSLIKEYNNTRIKIKHHITLFLFLVIKIYGICKKRNRCTAIAHKHNDIMSKDPNALHHVCSRADDNTPIQ